MLSPEPERCMYAIIRVDMSSIEPEKDPGVPGGPGGPGSPRTADCVLLLRYSEMYCRISVEEEKEPV